MLYVTAHYKVGSICYICTATDEVTSDLDSMDNVRGSRDLVLEEGINSQVMDNSHVAVIWSLVNVV